MSSPSFAGLFIAIASLKFAPIGCPLRNSRDKNTSSPQLTTVQVVNGIKGSVERIGGCVQFDLALGGQGHELNQIIVVANQVANKVDLGGDNINGRNSDTTV